jgi:hypothetical protein
LIELADELGATDDTRDKMIATMDREVRRKKKVFTRVGHFEDGVQRIALVSNRADAG